MAEIKRKWLLNEKAIPWKRLEEATNREKIRITQQYLELPTEEKPREVLVRRVKSKLGTKCYRIIKSYNETQGMVGEKQEKAIAEREFEETYRVLGMSPVIKRGERYLVDIPTDLEEFSDANNCTKQEIEQIYLKSDSGTERRIRKVGNYKFAAYYYTEKSRKGKDRFIQESIINSKEYHNLSAQADVSRKPIKKTRFSFVQGQEYFVLDAFPKGEYPGLPSGKAIIESKGTTRVQSEPVAPQGFSGLEDISDKPQYGNSKLAIKSNNVLFSEQSLFF